jgi:hypothetical protein
MPNALRGRLFATSLMWTVLFVACSSNDSDPNDDGALQCLHGGWGGAFEREMQSFFATMTDRIGEVWPDPAGLGPPISSAMDAQRVARAHTALTQAARQADLAINHVRQGRSGEALRVWRELFGPMFPLS